MKRCFSCKGALKAGARPGRAESCPFCGRDLKVCLNCSLYDPKAANECRETAADKVIDKDRANFCEFFSFKETEAVEGQKEDPMEKLRALFKKR